MKIKESKIIHLLYVSRPAVLQATVLFIIISPQRENYKAQSPLVPRPCLAPLLHGIEIELIT